MCVFTERVNTITHYVKISNMKTIDKQCACLLRPVISPILMLYIGKQVVETLLVSSHGLRCQFVHAIPTHSPKDRRCLLSALGQERRMTALLTEQAQLRTTTSSERALIPSLRNPLQERPLVQPQSTQILPKCLNFVLEERDRPNRQRRWQIDYLLKSSQSEALGQRVFPILIAVRVE